MNGQKPWYNSIRVWVFAVALVIVIAEAAIPGFEIDLERLKSITLLFSSFLVAESLRSVREVPASFRSREPPE